MSGPAVVIGFILLIPSVLGILFGLFVLVAAGVESSRTSTSEREKIRAQLIAHQIPESIITKISSGESVSDAELISLTYDQRVAVDDAQRAVAVQNIPGGIGVVVVILVIIASFVGGLLGWLFIMRKRILQCTRCGDVVPAS